jgi:Uma2 family endonuclease
MSTPLSAPSEVIYPDSDGQPMSDNTLQYEWIVALRYGLDVLFAGRPDVFVAADLLWYPVEGRPAVRQAPDVLVAFGRPKGYRGSYRQWQEDGIAPQVVFEVLSPGNRRPEMYRKFRFYDRYGVEEYVIIDPDKLTVEAWQRTGSDLEEVEELAAWHSPRLGIRFDRSESALQVVGPDGRPFATYEEIVQLSPQLDRERQRAEQERQRAERLAARLRELGQDPDA